MGTNHEVETRIAESLEVGDVPSAVRLVVSEYGGEILGFLVARLRDQVRAREVFAEFVIDLLEGLPGVRIEVSMRAYVYRVARSCASREGVRESTRRRRNTALGDVELAALVEEVRTRTPPHLRTDVKDAFARLRERLTDDERALLTLRIDRDLDWREVAVAFADGSEEPVDVVAARMRKRFELLKRKLRRLAEDEGLIGRD